MALDSRTLARQVEQTMNELNRYTPANAADIYQDLMARVNAFEPQYQELRGLENQAQAILPAQLDQFNQQYGTQGGAGAMTRLSQVFRNIGQAYGTRDVVADVINRMQGNLRGISESALGQYNAARQGLTDKYSMLNQQYQQALAQEEARRARAAAAAALNGFRYGNDGNSEQRQGVFTGQVGPSVRLPEDPEDPFGETMKAIYATRNLPFASQAAQPLAVGRATIGALSNVRDPRAALRAGARGAIGDEAYDVFKGIYSAMGRPGNL